MLVSKLKPKNSKLSIDDRLAHILCIEEVRYKLQLCVHLECLLHAVPIVSIFSHWTFVS